MNAEILQEQVWEKISHTGLFGKLFVDIEHNSRYDMIEISGISVLTSYRRKGLGDIALRMVLDIVTAHNTSVMLFPSPMGDSISSDNLIAWYEKHGFVLNEKKNDFSFKKVLT